MLASAELLAVPPGEEARLRPDEGAVGLLLQRLDGALLRIVSYLYADIHHFMRTLSGSFFAYEFGVSRFIVVHYFFILFWDYVFVYCFDIRIYTFNFFID